MRGAFLVQLEAGTEPAKGRFEGWVEEVDTGKRAKFQSAEEMVGFLGRAFEDVLRRREEIEGRTGGGGSQPIARPAQGGPESTPCSPMRSR